SASQAGQWRVLHHSAAAAEDRGADQGNREPGPPRLRLQLPGCGTVPWARRQAGLAPDMSNGASAPAEPAPINRSRLTDPVRTRLSQQRGSAILLVISSEHTGADPTP